MQSPENEFSLMEKSKQIPKILDGKFFTIEKADEKGNVKGKCELCISTKLISGNFRAIGNFKLHLQVSQISFIHYLKIQFNTFIKSINLRKD